MLKLQDSNVNPDVCKPLELISKLAACDGLPFIVIAQSQTIQQLFKNANRFQLPTSPNTVRGIVLKHHEQMKENVKHNIRILKVAGTKFSVSLDEWTSAANRRYMNINLHYSSGFWNLGLVRINGSCTAELCLALLKSKLFEFDLDLDYIIGLVTDGASVMKRFARLSGKKHVLCLAHGIHLAIVEVLYKTNTSAIDDLGLLDSDSELEDDDAYSSPFRDAAEENIEYEATINDIINRVRKIVKFFRKSPLKTEVLRKYSGTDMCPGPVLLLDSRTRWNSLLVMLERFYELKDAIQKALIDLHEPLSITDEEFNRIHEVITVLSPIKLATDAICRRDTDLVAADVSIQFMMTKLNCTGSDLSNKFFNALKGRILERRTILSEVASYLHHGNDEELQGHLDGYFTKVSRHNLIAQIKSIHEIFAATTTSQPQPPLADIDDTQASESLLLEISLAAELNYALNTSKSFKPGLTSAASTSRQSRDPNGALIASIKKEMHSLETFGTRGKILQPVNDMLRSIPACSVESERVFSSANNFCRKTRSKLGDRSMDALVFLKSYYQCNNKI